MKKGTLLLVIASAAVWAAALQAQVLNFEGIAATYPSSNYPFVQGFYNGGTSSDGTTGVNYGVEFSPNALAICLNSLVAVCSNTSRGGLGNPLSQRGGLFFLDGAQTFMNRSAGFTVGFSFLYAAINSGGSFSVFSGINGTGSLLGTTVLGTTTSNCVGYSAGFCPFVAGSLGFAGTGRSVVFAGVANQIVFDDVTFGSVIPDSPPPNTNAPEPASIALVAAGLAAVGAAARRRKNA